ncbi:hypothetical protein CE143_23275 [Photorhabdus luminescens]|uniref:Immunity protein 52 domain-containing protein n=1 Tax=Photorhabdus akhurstii TaxID=171438 RepID=A0ABX8M0W1_9GAMM|nr:immunity 52 family protein [Photorhabdus akhurstii]QXF35785.1 hypothetical protein B0X70_23240 [Photorhabdus akhurstii]UJD77616.1 hypothetical protein CE143_23275 [Photorhabdus luminescens]
MTTIYPRIELFHDLNESITPKVALNDLYPVVQQVNKLSNKQSGWHLPENSLEERLLYRAFDENGPTEYALKHFEATFDEKSKLIVKSLSDGNYEDNNSILYTSEDEIYNNPIRLGKTNISINISLKKEDVSFDKFIVFIKNLISNCKSPFILVDTRGYSLKQKQVFPDRVYAGWMLYLPIEIDPTLVPMAEEIISISDKNDKKGSLIITTKDIFDIENQEHINKANDIEICLRDLQILPLMTEL